MQSAEIPSIRVVDIDFVDGGTTERHKERQQNLQGADIKSTSRPASRAAKGSASKAPVHGEYQRIVPVYTPEFAYLYGKRNISESMHRSMKRRRGNQHVRGMALQTFYSAFGSLLWNAIQAHHMQLDSESPPG